MASKRPHWDTYNKEMSQFNFGHALWEPGPLTYFKRIQLGDVGYIYAGRFRLLFSAGCPLGKRRRGIDVPHTFKPLEAGEIDDREPLPAGYLGTSGVQVTGALPRPASSTPSISPTSVQPRPPSSPPMSETASTISFQLTGGQGAVLLTKYSTYREDTLHGGAFEKYAKEHYNSWVAFAREAGHGDVNPVLVTGVDRTKDFAMLCYSNDDQNLRCDFTASAPGTAPDWGTWQKTGLVYTNHGPQLRRPSSVQTENLTSSGNDTTELVSDEYNQSVFIRYFTMRKRLGVPRIIKAGAGPHDLGRRGHDDDESSLEAPYSSDTGTDTEASFFDSGEEDDGCSVTSLETESDILIHNVAADGRDDFDVVANYIFENSDAESVLLHHRDIALVRERGDGANLTTLLFEMGPAITVDSNGVGVIEPRAVSPAETRLGLVTTLTLPFPPGEGEQETANDGGLSEPRPLTHSELEGPVCGVYTVDYVIETNAPRYVQPRRDRISYDKTVRRLSDTAGGGRKMRPPVKFTLVEAKTLGSEPLNIDEQRVALASRRRAIFVFPQLAQSVSFFCSGLLRGKYALSLVSLSVVAFGAVSLQWHLWGYLHAFNEGTNAYIGNLKYTAPEGVEGEPSIITGVNFTSLALEHVVYLRSQGYTYAPKNYSSGDISWILASTALTRLMVPGVGTFYSGLLRRRKALPFIYLSLAVLLVGLFGWFFRGYSLTFSESANAYISDLKFFALEGVEGRPSVGSSRIPALVFWIYQCMFAAITPVIAVGAVAERGRLGPILLFAFIWSNIVYNPLACMTWNLNGWSFANGGPDFAGGTPVHISSGTAALAISIYLGKRHSHETEKFVHRPRSATYVVLGTVLLWFGWFGWFGFNGASALAANARAASVYVVTNLAAVVGGITWMLWDYRLKRKWSVAGFCSGAVSGLVAIIPASGYVGSAAAVLFGVVAGTVCNFATRLRFTLGYDDPSDIFASHAVGGVVGNLLTGLFAQSSIANLDWITAIRGGWVDKNYIQLALQLTDSATGLSYSFVMTTMILWVMHFIPFCRLRVDEIPELIGNNQPQMGGHAYDQVGPDLEKQSLDDACSATSGGRESRSPHVCEGEHTS